MSIEPVEELRRRYLYGEVFGGKGSALQTCPHSVRACCGSPPSCAITGATCEADPETCTIRQQAGK